MVNATFGPAFARTMRGQGWPAATADDRRFWAPGSLIQNAASIDTPLLMQLADREYLSHALANIRRDPIAKPHYKNL